MKIRLCKVVLGLLLGCLIGGSASAQGRVGTVDLRKIFENYWKKKEAEASLKDRETELLKDDKAMTDELKSAKEAYQTLLTDANNQALSSEEREKRKKSAEDKFKQVKQLEDNLGEFERTARARMKEQSERMRANLLNEIKAAVSSKAKAAGYSLVIDSAAESANATPVILYNNNESDITDTVLAQLNAGARPETPGSEDKKDQKKDEKKKSDK
jgi:outer membrane protein